MVIGIGNDITECARIQKILEKHGSLFLDHFLTGREKEESNGRLSYYAGRWAAKEAIAKAFGCGIGGQCSLNELEILNNPQGKPEVTLYGEMLPQPAYENAVSLIRFADCLIVGGTSLEVGSAAQLAHMFHGKHLIIINKSKTRLEGKADIVFHDSIGEILSEIAGE